MVKKSAANLTLIRTAPAADPLRAPSDLGEAGAELWRSIQSQYQIDDAGGLAMLELACASADRAQKCKQQIDKEGEVVRGRTGVRDHPLLKHELAARSFTVRTLLRLGLDVEPLHGRPGRPAGS